MDLGKRESIAKVSVIVAVYNAEQYLRQALDSIVIQTLKEIEIICVDDNSTDSSLSILREYERMDPRVVVIENTIPSDGAALARNIGIKKATGKYLSVLDADDFFEPDMLKKAYLRAEEKKAEVVIFNGWVYDEKLQSDRETGTIVHMEYIEKEYTFSPLDMADNLFILTSGAAWNCIFSRKLINENDIWFQSYHHADDLGFVYLSFACAERISIEQKKLVHYRNNVATSQAYNISQWPETVYLSLMSLKKELEKRGLFSWYKVSFVQKAMEYIMFYLDRMRTADCFIVLYNKIRNTYLEKLGISSVSDDKFVDPYMRLMKRAVQDFTVEQYLFRRLKGMEPFDEENAWFKLIPSGAKVVVYGAGNIGTAVVSVLLRRRECTLVAWVDQKYKELGYPVMNPVELSGLQFDYVIVGIVLKRVFERVREYLIEAGIAEEKIKWIRQELPV